MSQKVARKGAPHEDKDKPDTPVKEMKKKMAANAEKEKHAAEKLDKEKAVEKQLEKKTEKSDKTEKVEKKTADKIDKTEKVEKKTADKIDKTEKVEKKTTDKIDKTEKVDKKIATQEKLKEDSKGETSGKDKEKRSENTRSKQNGKAHNGVSDVTLNSNGGGDVTLNTNGAVSDTDEEEPLVIEETDELFPELTYDDTSDVDTFEPPTPEATSRSLTRRSQAKVTRTPETPRPSSDKQPDREEESKDSKILKLKEDAQSTERKLRSSDSPKPIDAKKGQESKKTQEMPKKTQEEAKKGQETGKNLEKGQDKNTEKGAESAKNTSHEPKKDEKSREDKENADKSIEIDVDVIETENGQEESRKPDTNYSKSRVKVSPYRRSMRLADQTTSSVMANYTGNNTTMEMDITESSVVSEASACETSYLGGLRGIRGRRSYKLLADLPPRPARTPRPPSAHTEQPSRPTGTVVGRKRRAGVEVGVEASEEFGASSGELAGGKRARLLDRIAQPFRSLAHVHVHLPRRTPEIVGINSDLPLTAPVASAESFDPEALKSEGPALGPGPGPALQDAAPLHDKDSKRCVVM